MTLRTLALCLALAGSTGACTITDTVVGWPFPEGVDELQVGRTTKGEALALLGAPNSIRRQFDGDLLLWERLQEHGRSLLLFPLINLYFESHESSRSERLALLFDHQGLLVAVGIERGLEGEGEAAAVGARASGEGAGQAAR